MSMAAGAVASAAVDTAKAVRRAAPAIKPARGITTALVGALLVVGIAEVKGKGTSVLDPRPFVATFGVFIIIGFIAELNAALGRMLAVLAFVSILLARGEDALDGLLGQSTTKRKRKRQPEGRK